MLLNIDLYRFSLHRGNTCNTFRERVRMINGGTRRYTLEVHRAAFTLAPSFVPRMSKEPSSCPCRRVFDPGGAGADVDTGGSKEALFQQADRSCCLTTIQRPSYS